MVLFHPVPPASNQFLIVKRTFAFACLMLAYATAWSQPRNGLLVPPTLSDGPNEAPYIYLAEGNQFEYRITYSINGVAVDPAFLRFTVTGAQNPVADANDYLVLVQTYSSDKLIRQAECYLRQQRGRIHLLGASNMGSSDCNWQSPFSQQDMVVSEMPAEVPVGEVFASVASTGTYEHFWGDQNGDNGFISFRYAEGIGLYRFQSRTSDSPMEPNQKHEDWLGELQYARIDGVEHGESLVSERFDAADVVPELTPAQ
jgi:hypothetical protein